MDSRSTFAALYAKNTSKKRKQWSDGSVVVDSIHGNARKRVTLQTEDGRVIETQYTKAPIAEGEELEFEGHLIQICEPKGPAAAASVPAPAVQPQAARRKPMPTPRLAERPALAAYNGPPSMQSRPYQLPTRLGLAPPASAAGASCVAGPSAPQAYAAGPSSIGGSWGGSSLGATTQHSAPAHNSWLAPKVDSAPRRTPSQLLAMLQGAAPPPAEPPRAAAPIAPTAAAPAASGSMGGMPPPSSDGNPAALQPPPGMQQVQRTAEISETTSTAAGGGGGASTSAAGMPTSSAAGMRRTIGLTRGPPSAAGFLAPRQQPPSGFVSPRQHPPGASAAPAGRQPHSTGTPAGAGGGKPHGGSAASGKGPGGALSLSFPSVEACRIRQSRTPSGAAPPSRAVRWSSLASYRHDMGSALQEQINLPLLELARRYHACHGQKGGPRSRGLAFYGEAALRLGAGPAAGGDGWVRKRRRGDNDGSDEEDATSRGGARSGGGGGGQGSGAGERRIFLTLSGPREASSAFAMDDLWVVASSCAMEGVCFLRALWHGPSRDGTIEVEVLGSPPRGMVRSQPVVALRGPNVGDVLAQLSVIGGLSLPSAPAQPSSPPLLRFLLDPAAAPNTPPLALRPSADARCDAEAEAAPQTSFAAAAALPREQLFGLTARRFRLNAEQQEVLRRVAAWFGGAGAGPGGGSEPGVAATSGATVAGAPPCVLVHGVFGSGKSTLLVAVIFFLQRLLHHRRPAAATPSRPGVLPGRASSAAPAPVRILLCSLTNVAVDNVLESLLDQAAEDGESCDDPCGGGGEAEGDEAAFGDGGGGGGGGGGGVKGVAGILRVGSLQRISRRVLPHSTHGKLDASGESAVRKELEHALHGAPSDGRAGLLGAMQELDAGRMRARARAVQQYAVVGATCAATGLPVFAGSSFDVCLLDECSQITEPASLLPLARLSCARLLAVGDPMQLPPTLHEPADGGGGGGGGGGGRGSQLALTLFERLVGCGVRPVLLRQQYRCPPQLSSLASRLFYGGQLRDGLGAAALTKRGPLVVGLPTLGFCETRGSENLDRGGSISNHAEAERAVRLIGALRAAGLQPEQLGVICLYRAQAALLTRLLAEAPAAGGADGGGHVTVSTVDAFQGAERDVVIVSCCRTTDLGFLASRRRLNVTITRARHHLLVIGSAPALLTDGAWSALLGEAQPLPSSFYCGGGAAAPHALTALGAGEAEPEAEQGGDAAAGTASPPIQPPVAPPEPDRSQEVDLLALEDSDDDDDDDDDDGQQPPPPQQPAQPPPQSDVPGHDVDALALLDWDI